MEEDNKKKIKNIIKIVSCIIVIIIIILLLLKNCKKEELPSTINIIYSGNGINEPIEESVERGVKIKISENTPVREGYTFLGWTDIKNSIVVKYYPGKEYIFNEDTQLYAVWKKERKEEDIKEEEPIVIIEDDGSKSITNNKNNGRSKTQNKAKNIIKQYTVTFNYGYNNVLSVVKVNNKEKLKSLPETNSPYSVFDGWYTSRDFENEVDIETPITKNTTYYAKYKDAVFDKGINVSSKAITLAGYENEIQCEEYNGREDCYINIFGEYWNDKNAGGVIKEFNRISPIPSEYEQEDYLISSSDSEVPIYMWYDNDNKAINWYSIDPLVDLNEDASSMFSNLDTKSIDLSDFSSKNTKNMSYMFNGSIFEELDVSSLDTSNVTDMTGMFLYTYKLKELDLSTFNTSNVKYMNWMFEESYGLEELNISSFNTSNVTDMQYMFDSMSSIRHLDVSNFDTSKTENMNGMFSYTPMLESLDVSNFNTSNVKEIGYMFSECGVTSLNLSSFDLSKVEYSDGMLDYSPLITLVTPKVYPENENVIIVLPKTMYDSGENEYYELNNDSPTKKVLSVPSVSILLNGNNINDALYSLTEYYDEESNTYKNYEIKEIKKSNSRPNFNNCNYYEISESETIPTYAWFDNGVIYYYSDADTIYFNEDSSYMFAGLSNVTNIEISTINSKYLETTEGMFYDDFNLRSIDLSNISGANLVNTSYMFNDCTMLESVKLSNINTSNVENVSYMFFGCSMISSIDLSQFDLTNVVNQAGMLDEMSSLIDLITPKKYSSNESLVINLPKVMFDSSENEYYILDIDAPTKTKLTAPNISILLPGSEVNSLFDDMIDLSNIRQIKRTNTLPNSELLNNSIIISDSGYMPTRAWFEDNIIYYYSDAETVYFNRDSSFLFSDLTNVVNIDLSNISSEKVENYEGMFSYDSKLLQINLSNFNTENATNMAGMFYGCSSLGKLNLNKFNMSNVTNVDGMISDMSLLYQLITPDVYPSDSNVVIPLSKTLYDSEENEYNSLDNNSPTKTLLSINEKNAVFLSGWNFNSTVYDNFYQYPCANGGCELNEKIYQLRSFEKSSSLNVIDNYFILSSNDSSYPIYAWNKNDTLYYYTEANNVYLNEDAYGMFQYFTYLTNIDLSGINTSQTTNMSYMFSNCEMVSKLDLSGFDLSRIEYIDGFLGNNKSLIELITPSSYPQDDNFNIYLFKTFYDNNSNNYTELTKTSPTNTKLTVKSEAEFDYGENFNYYLYNHLYDPDSDMYKIDDFKHFRKSDNMNTNEYTIVSSSDSSYPIYAWLEDNTYYYYSEAKDIYFHADSSYMFAYFNSLEDVDLSSINTEHIENTSSMFYGCQSLKTLDLSTFDLSNVTYAENMFGDNYSLTELITPKEYPQVTIELCKALSDINNNMYSRIDENTPKQTKLIVPNIAILKNGNDFNSTLVNLAGSSSNIINIIRSTERPNIDLFDESNIISSNDGLKKVYAWYDNGTIYYYSDEEVIYYNCDSSYLFGEFNNLINVDLSSIDSSFVTNIYGMFYNCSSISTIDLSSLDFSGVNNTYDMFVGANSLRNIITPKGYGQTEILLTKTFIDENDNEYTKLTSDSPKKTQLSYAIIAELDNGMAVNSKLKKLAGGYNSTSNSINTNIIRFERSNNEPSENNKGNNNRISAVNSNYPVYAWFNNGTIYYYSSIEKIRFNEDSSYLFNNFRGLTTLDLNDFYTSKTKNMKNMFSTCIGLTSLKLGDGFDTSNVTTMHEMFSGCRFESLNLGSKFDTSNVTNMFAMFRYCENLTSLNLGSKFDTSNVTTIEEMFNQCYKLITLDLGDKFDTSNCTNMALLFRECRQLESLDLGNKFNTSKVTAMNAMFEGIAVTSLDLSGFDTSNVTNMSWMFSTSKIESLNLGENFDTSNVIDMSYMFSYCSGLINIDLGSKFNTSNVTNMSQMFVQCLNLKSLNLGTKFDTSKVTDMSSIFSNCSKLISLDLSTFDLSSCTNFSNLLSDTNSLTRLKTPKNMSNKSILLYKSMSDSDNNIYTSIDSDTPINIWLEIPNIAYLDKGTNVNIKFKKLAGNTSVNNYSSLDNNIMHIKKSVTPPNLDSISEDNIISIGQIPVYAWYKEGIIYYYSESNTIYLNTDSSYLYNNLSKLESVELVSFDTSKVMLMSNMFYKCSKLVSLNLSGFDTSNVTSMDNMFAYCESLNSLNISTFDTSNVENMYGMFNNCKSLTSLNLTNFVTLSVIHMDYMLYNCTGMLSLDLSSFDLSKASSTTNMLVGISSLTSLITPKIMPSSSVELPKPMSDSNDNEYTSLTSSTPTNTLLQLRNIARLDKGTIVNQKLKRLSGQANVEYSTENTTITKIEKSTTAPNLSNMTSDNIISIDIIPVYAWYEEGVIYYYSESETIYLGNNSTCLFYLLKSLQSVDLSGFDTSKVKNMSSMFYECNNLLNIDLSNFDTSNVYDMHLMFYGCSSFTNLDLSNFNTSNLTGIYGMFTKCSGLSSLDLSNFDTSKVEGMSHLFAGCSNLTDLNISSFNTSKVRTMYGMFSNCSSLTSLNLSNFDTSNVREIYAMFYKCSNLTSLDLSNFDTSNVYDMHEMFYGCSSLTVVYVSELWNTSHVQTNNYLGNNTCIGGCYSIFYGCDNLIGPSGTKYNSFDSRCVMEGDIKYARVDKQVYDSESGTWSVDETKPGLFTYKAHENISMNYNIIKYSFKLIFSPLKSFIVKLYSFLV